MVKNSEVLQSSKSLQVKRWKPQLRERYYMILGDGEIKSFLWEDTFFDKKAWRLGNCFRLKKEAVQALTLFRYILDHYHKEYV